ncbi:MAG: hypothetical protein E7605_07550 [Ruminococcaceae bacterium]|nr:hypothetical protein [Oscillospiraceae bacterium]
MARRPVYRVSDAAPYFVCETVEFSYNGGFAVSQKQKNIVAIHASFKLRMLTVWMNKNLKSLSGLEDAVNLECLQFYTAFSDVSVHKIASFAPISNLKKLKEVIVSATESLDHNIDYLIDLPNLEYLWVSPNLFPTECYAKFEAKKFKLSDEYGIYCEENDDIYPYGKGKRVMHTAEQKNRYLNEYNELLQKYNKV